MQTLSCGERFDQEFFSSFCCLTRLLSNDVEFGHAKQGKAVVLGSSAALESRIGFDARLYFVEDIAV